ncbi:unnamed protein product [Blepharisma stoltei]|uniref:PWWP domain-containing protein n=1 Tax=Blepharisma stoltei TaxID=1481888 RepID=A0AAU9J1R5_9CILI|nr:unnamed protein product [Blepharisma stoltei]
MERKFHEGQLVWAKVESHPWWPAIIDSIEENNPSEFDEVQELKGTITVNLIGENKYAHLSPAEIADYEEAYRLHSNANDEKLKNCIIIANKFLAKEIDIANLEEVNTNLIAFLQKKKGTQEARDHAISDDEIKRVVKEINKHLDSKIALNERTTDLSGLCSNSDAIRHKLEEFMKLLTIFIDHAESTSHFLPALELCNCLSFIVQIIPDSSLLEASKILKCIKTFKNKLKESSNSLLKFVSHICHKLYLFWKKSLINASIKSLVTSDRQQINRPDEQEASWSSRNSAFSSNSHQGQTKKVLTGEDVRKFNMMNSLNANSQELLRRYKSGTSPLAAASRFPMSPRGERKPKTMPFTESPRNSLGDARFLNSSYSDKQLLRPSSPKSYTRQNDPSSPNDMILVIESDSPEENKRIEGVDRTHDTSQIQEALLAIRKRELKRDDLSRLREGQELPESLVDCYLSILKHTNSLRVRYTPGAPKIMIASSSISKMIFMKGKEISQPEPKIFKHDFLIFPINTGYWTLLIVDLKNVVVKYCDPAKEHRSISVLIGKLARFIQKATPKDLPKVNTNYQFVATPVPDINRDDTGIYICNEVENLACGKQNIINRETGDNYRKSMLLSLVKASGAGV